MAKRLKPVEYKNVQSSNRGHLIHNGRCIQCGAKKPKRGGWSVACKEDKRAFMGG